MVKIKEFHQIFSLEDECIKFDYQVEMSFVSL